MKTLFRILVIILIFGVVAGAAYLILNDSSTTSIDAGSPPTFDGAPPDFQAGAAPVRPDGGDRGGESALLGGGSSEITGNLLKISVITVAVVLLQFVFNLLRKRKKALPVIG